jgi:hypothetical protein
VKGKVTRVVRSPYCDKGRMYMVNAALLQFPDAEEESGIWLVVWDDDEIVRQASTLIGEYIEIETGKP